MVGELPSLVKQIATNTPETVQIALAYSYITRNPITNARMITMTTKHDKKRPVTAEDLYDLQLAANPSISPNGETVAYSVQRVDKKTEKNIQIYG